MNSNRGRDSTFCPQNGPNIRLKGLIQQPVWLALAFSALSLGAVQTNQPAGDRLIWNKLRDRVEADVRDLPLIRLLERGEYPSRGGLKIPARC